MTLQLNLGCGDEHLEGFVNIDLREDVADLCCDVRKLPYETGTVEAIVAFDILEHLPPTSTVDALTEWHRVLAPGGTLTLKVPNLLALAQWIVEAQSPAMAIRNIYGGHRYGDDGELDCHHTGWTPDLLDTLLRDVGFAPIANNGALNMTVTATKEAAMVAPEDYRTVGVMKRSAAGEKEAQFDKDRSAYQRLRKQGLQPPNIDGCAALEAQAVTRDEITTGVVKPWIAGGERKKEAKLRREAFDRAREITG